MNARVERLIEDADLDGFAAWLSASDPAELAEAGKWFQQNRRRVYHLYRWDGDIAQRLGFSGTDRVYWFEALFAVALSGPATAAKRVPWKQFWAHQELPALPVFVDVATARGAAWCAEFVRAAASVRMSERELGRHGAVLFRAISPLVVRWELPVPVGDAFAVGWLDAVDGNGTPGEIVARWATDPFVPEVVHYLVGAGFARDWGFWVPLLAAAVEAGVLDRGRLIGHAFDLLTGIPRMSTQRVLAGTLEALELRADEIPGGLPFVQGLLATGHGSVVALLLPYALAALRSTDDVVELSTTIAARLERKPKLTLLSALGNELRSRLGAEPVLAGLDVLRDAAVDDPQLLARVDRVRSNCGGVGVIASDANRSAEGLWDRRPPGEPRPAAPIGRVAGLTERVVTTLQDRLRTRHWGHEYDRLADIWPDVWLTAIFRQAGRDGRQPVREFLAALQPDNQRSFELAEAIHDWIVDDSVEGYLAAVLRGGVLYLDERRAARPFSLSHPMSAFDYLVAREALLRLGRSPVLLSTPTHDDGSVEFDALVARLEVAQGTSAGPLDLLQALLRLRPVDPAELGRLDGLSLPVDADVVPPRRALAVTDAVDAVRDWVDGGGLPALNPAVASLRPWAWGQISVFDPVLRNPPQDHWVLPALPVPVEAFGSVPRGLFAPGSWPNGRVQAIVPRWPDLCLLREPPGEVWYGGPNLSKLVLRREAPVGRLTVIRMFKCMGDADGDTRAHAAELALALMAEGRFDEALFVRVALERLELGWLSLSRVVRCWDLMAPAGGLRQLWPVWLAVADACLRRRPKPAGFAELLALLGRYVHEVPEPAFPASVIAFARERGSTKSHHEARALVSAVERRSA